MSRTDRIKRKIEREQRRFERTGLTKDERVQRRKDRVGDLTRRLYDVAKVAVPITGTIEDIATEVLSKAKQKKADLDSVEEKNEETFHKILELDDIIKESESLYTELSWSDNELNEHVVKDKANAREAASKNDKLMDLSIWSVKHVLRWAIWWIMVFLFIELGTYYAVKDDALRMAVAHLCGMIIGKLLTMLTQALSFPIGSSAGSKEKSIIKRK